MELKDTIEMMQSPAYQERFKAEVYQLDIRIGKLAGLLSKWIAGELDFTPTCSYVLLETQLNSMKVYRHILQMRAENEGIDLYDDCDIDCTKCAHAHKTAEHEWECDAKHYDIEGLSCFIPKDKAL